MSIWKKIPKHEFRCRCIHRNRDRNEIPNKVFPLSHLLFSTWGQIGGKWIVSVASRQSVKERIAACALLYSNTAVCPTRLMNDNAPDMVLFVHAAPLILFLKFPNIAN